MFKAITKDKNPNSSSRGTLSAFWQKKTHSKLQDGGAGAAAGEEEAGEEASLTLEPAPQPGGQPERTPEPAGRQDQAEAALLDPTEPGGAQSQEPLATAGQGTAAAVEAPDQGPAEQQQQQQQQQPKPQKAKKASGGTAGQKRARGEDFSPEQLARLEALFAADKYAKAEAKQALADDLGLELALVHKWFNNRRNKARQETGAPAKRGRPKKASGAGAAAAAAPGAAAVAGSGSGSGAEVPAECSAAEAAAPPTVGMAAAEAGEQWAAAPGGEGAMELDSSGGAGAGALQQAQQADVGMMDLTVDETAEAGAEEAALAVTPTPAGPAGPGEEAGAAAAEPQAGPEAQPADTPAVDTQPTAATAAATPAADGADPKPTPAVQQQHVISGEEKERLLAELAAEVQQLQEEGLGEPLHGIPQDLEERIPFSDGKLASLVAGQRLALSQLVVALLPVFKAAPAEGADGAGAPLEEAVLRSKIVDLAARKAAGPKDGGSSLVDALEDASAVHLWHWEVRDTKVLPKAERPAALALKRRASKVQERLSAVGTATKLLRAHKEGPAGARLNKALEALGRVKTLAQILAQQEADVEQQAAKLAAKKATQSAPKPKLTEEEKERVKAEREADKERARAEKEAEKERAMAEREAEKERAKAEKEAEKERAKAEKEAEKEQKKKEAEAQKQLRKTGFKDVAALAKTASKFTSFFKPKAAQGPGAGAPAAAGAATPGAGTPGPGAGAGAATPSCSLQQSAGAGASAAGTGTVGLANRGGGGATTVKKQPRGFWEVFKPPGDCSYSALPSAADSMDVLFQQQQQEAGEAAAGQPAAAASPDAVEAEWQHWVARGKRARAEAKQNRVLGMPSGWARVSNAREVAQRRLQRLQDSGVPLSQVRCLKLQFLWFEGDKTPRPAFYGIRHYEHRGSVRVRPRNPLFKYSIPGMDYGEMSDCDWEEEPEGEALSDDEDAQSEMSAEASEANDSFVVETGYLSEDEGIKSDAGEDDAEADSGELAPGAAGAPDACARERDAKRKRLEAQLERARRAGRPYIISRLRPPAPVLEGQATPFISGDVALLDGLAMEVLVPGAKITAPPDPLAEAAPLAAAETPAGGAKAGGARAGAVEAAAPRSDPGPREGKLERPEELLPELAAYLKANPKAGKNKVVADILAAHPGRKIVKKWLQDKVKELAEWQSTQWVLRQEALRLLEAHPQAPAAPTAAAARGLAPAPAAVAEQAMPDAAEAPLGGAAGAPAAAGHKAAGGPMDRFLKSKREPKTPAPPSTLPQEPAPATAPDRPATNAAQPAAAAKAKPSLPPLSIPEEVASTSDPYWHTLLLLVESADSCPPASEGAGSGRDAGGGASAAAWPFEAAFTPAVLARHAAAMPAFLMTALVTGLSSDASGSALRASYARCLSRSVAALAERSAAAAIGEELQTISQQVWATSSTCPVQASLPELCREPHLVPALHACLAAASAAATGLLEQPRSELEAQLAAGRAALEAAAPLLRDPALRGALGEAAAGGAEAVLGMARAAVGMGGGAVRAWAGDAGVEACVAAAREAVAAVERERREGGLAAGNVVAMDADG